MSPAEHAHAIRTWCAEQHDPEQALQVLASESPILLAINAVADAADSPDAQLCSAGIEAVFATLVEAWNDRFDEHGRACYGAVFGRIVWRVLQHNPQAQRTLQRFGITSADDLLARWQRVRRNHQPLAAEGPHRIVILSRVTLGADILLTSVVLQRLRMAYPQAKLIVIGDKKLQGLLGGMQGVHIETVRYARRGRLGERLQAWLEILSHVDALAPDVVISPDSRMDQLGLLPVIEDNRYYLWENLQHGDHARSLSDMLDEWLMRLLPRAGGSAVRPGIFFTPPLRKQKQTLRDALGARPLAAVKLDHGGNPAKALPPAAVERIVRTLQERGWRIMLDRGFGEEELAESDRLIQRIGMSVVDIDDSGNADLGQAVDQLAIGALSTASVVRFHGSIAGWATAVSCCQLAFSYDSVGHHLAAALDVPLVVAFTGHDHDDFPVSWAPRGNGPIDIVVIPTAEKDDPRHWQAVCDRLMAAT